MPDPVTIGAFVVSVFTKAIEAGAGEFAKNAGKGAFEALKAKLSHWAGHEVAALEDASDSPKRQNAVAEIIDRQTEQERDALRVLAQTLIDELKNSSDPSVALVFRDLENVAVNLKRVEAEGGAIGGVFDAVKGGTITIEEAKAKGRSGN